MQFLCNNCTIILDMVSCAIVAYKMLECLQLLQHVARKNNCAIIAQELRAIIVHKTTALDVFTSC